MKQLDEIRELLKSLDDSSTAIILDSLVDELSHGVSKLVTENEKKDRMIVRLQNKLDVMEDFKHRLSPRTEIILRLNHRIRQMSRQYVGSVHLYFVHDKNDFVCRHCEIDVFEQKNPSAEFIGVYDQKVTKDMLVDDIGEFLEKMSDSSTF